MSRHLCRPENLNCEQVLTTEPANAGPFDTPQTGPVGEQWGISSFLRQKEESLRALIPDSTTSESVPNSLPADPKISESHSETQPSNDKHAALSTVFQHLTDAGVTGVDRGEPNLHPTYETKTFRYLKKISSDVNSLATKYGIPADAIAGAIGDEYNGRGFKDDVQDNEISAIGKRFSGMDSQDPASIIWKQQIEWAEMHGYSPFEKSAKPSTYQKLTNPITWDVGPANFNVMTAMSLVKNNEMLRASLIKSGILREEDPPEIQADKVSKHLLTDHGTVEFTAAYMQESKKRFAAANSADDSASPGLDFGSDIADPDRFSANLVSSYKEGPAFVARALNNHRDKANRECSPFPYKVHGWPEFLKNRRAIRDALEPVTR